MRLRKSSAALLVFLSAAWVPGALAFGSAPTADNAWTYSSYPGNDVGFNVSGSDPDGDPISFELAQDDGMGGYTYSSSLTLTTDRGDSVDVTMSPGGYVSVHPQTSNPGVVTVYFVARDGSFTCGGGTSDVSSPASAEIRWNNAPVADDLSVSTPVDTRYDGNLSANDADGDSLNFNVASTPSHGSATVNGDGSFSYEPDAGFEGVDSFNFYAEDSTFQSNQATVTVTVGAGGGGNAAPSVNGVTITGPKNTTLTGALSATDPDGDPITFTQDSSAANGVASVSSTGAVSYVPTPGWNGTDSFTLHVSDDQGNDGAPVTVTLVVTNSAPVTQDLSWTTYKNSGTGAVVVPTDADGDALSLSAGPAAHGTPSTTGAFPLSYEPAPGFSGVDAFEYRAFDGTDYSASGTVTVQVVNRAPTAAGLSGAGNQGAQVSLTLSGADPDGDAVTYRVVQFPQHGTVGLSGAALVYVPDAGYSGPDSLSYAATDGDLEGAPAAVSLTVNPTAANHAPAVSALSLSGAAGSVISGAASATDADGDPVTFLISDFPAYGGARVSGNAVSYVPNPGFSGSDSFTLRGTDGSLEGSALVTVTVSPSPAGNAAPTVPGSVTMTGAQDSVATATLSASDADGDPVTFEAASYPAHGWVRISGSTVQYFPEAGYVGSDSFAYRAFDGTDRSATGAVSVTVSYSSGNHLPTLSGSLAMTGAMNSAVTGSLLAVDADGDALTFEIGSYPAHGWLSVSGSTAEYYPVPGFWGSDSFTYRAFDGTDRSSSATATVNVPYSSGNTAPVVASGSFSVASNRTHSFTMSGSDADGDVVSFAVTQAPAHGTVTFLYTPAAGYVGADSFSFRGWDGAAGSATGSFTVNVTSAVPAVPTPSCGGGSTFVPKDACPMGDYSASAYDGLCGDPKCAAAPELNSAPQEPKTASLSSTVYVVQDWCPYSDEDYASIEYADVQDSPEKEGINTFTRNCVVRGRTRTAFEPLDTTTRAEMAAIAIRATGVKYDLEGRKTSFADVPLKDWKTGVMERALRLNAVEGVFGEDGKFYGFPDEKVTRAEAVHIVLSALDLYRQPALKVSAYSDVASNPQLTYLLRAEELGILKSTVARGKAKPAFRPDAPITRQDAIRLVKEALKKRYQTQLNEFVKAGEIQVAK